MRRGRIRSSVRTEPRRTPPLAPWEQFLLVAIELAHHIGVNGPRCDLRSLRLLAFAVGLLVGRANEGALDKSSSTYKSNTKQYQMPLIDTRQFVE